AGELNRSANGLADAEEVPFAVAKPGRPVSGAFGRVVPLDVGNAVHGPEPGRVDLLELDAPAPELGDDRVDVVDLEPHLGVLSRRPAGRLEQPEEGGPALVPEAAAGRSSDGLGAELRGVKGPARWEIGTGEPRRDFGALSQQHHSGMTPVTARSHR